MPVSTALKRTSVLFLFVLISSLPALADINEEPTKNELAISIDPASAWSEDYNVTALGLISVSATPYNSSYPYHFTIHNGTNYQILSRYNVTGELFFNFIWEGIFRAYLWNPGGEELDVDFSLYSDDVLDAEGFGYYFDFEENRCLQATVLSYTDFILPISHLERGEYKIKISTFEDNANLKFYLSDLNPSEEENWKDNATAVTWNEFMEKNFQVDEGYDWIVLSSLDGYSHTIILVMIYLGGNGLKTQDTIIIVVLVAALILLFSTQISNRKKKKNRKNYYSTKPSRQCTKTTSLGFPSRHQT